MGVPDDNDCGLVAREEDSTTAETALRACLGWTVGRCPRGRGLPAAGATVGTTVGGTVDSARWRCAAGTCADNEHARCKCLL